MLNGYGIARLGRDIELTKTNSGEVVGRLSLAFDLRVKGEKKTQWIDGALWGKRAESLAPYLLKGKQVVVALDTVYIDEYEKNGATMSKLVARVNDVGLVSDSGARPAPPPVAKPATSTGFDDMSDDIPF